MNVARTSGPLRLRPRSTNLLMVLSLSIRKPVPSCPRRFLLTEAARFFARYGAVNVEKCNLADVVEKFIDQLKAHNRSKRHVEDARERLHKLAASFNTPIDEISQRELLGWPNALKGAGRTKNNFRGLLVSLFRYDRVRGVDTTQDRPAAPDGDTGFPPGRGFRADGFVAAP